MPLSRQLGGVTTHSRRLHEPASVANLHTKLKHFLRRGCSGGLRGLAWPLPVLNSRVLGAPLFNIARQRRGCPQQPEAPTKMQSRSLPASIHVPRTPKAAEVQMVPFGPTGVWRSSQIPEGSNTHMARWQAVGWFWASCAALGLLVLVRDT